MAKFSLFLAVVLASFLTGCVAKFDPPSLANFSQKEFIVAGKQQNLRLIVSHDDDSYRFALFDALGAPLADRELRDGRFRSLKFLPPNSSLNELFIGVLTIIKRGASSGRVRTSSDEYEVRNVY